MINLWNIIVGFALRRIPCTNDVNLPPTVTKTKANFVVEFLHLIQSSAMIRLVQNELKDLLYKCRISEASVRVFCTVNGDNPNVPNLVT